MKRERQRTADRKFLRQSHVRLISRRAALIEAYHSAKGNTKASTTGGTEDYIDYAVSSYERDFSLSLTELERKQLLLVEEALGRIRRSEYGRWRAFPAIEKLGGDFLDWLAFQPSPQGNPD